MINIKGSYNKEFYIFKIESNKYSILGKEQSGYLKIETKGDKAKLKVYFENILSQDYIKYFLEFYTLVGETKCIKSMSIRPLRGVIDRNMEFLCSNFEGSGVGIDSISIVAIIAEEQSDRGQTVREIVAGAHKKEASNWVDKIRDLKKTNESTSFKRENNNESDKNINKINNNSSTTNNTENINTYIEQPAVSYKQINKEYSQHLQYPELEKATEKFDEYFQRVDPFGTGRRDYEWWWVNNPVFLNNILYEFKIKRPLMFKPEIMDSHFKYKHIIIGLFHEENSTDKYLIFGIPGNSDFDKQPSDVHSVWIKAGFDFQGNNTFGYWLIYFEPNSGEIIQV